MKRFDNVLHRITKIEKRMAIIPEHPASGVAAAHEPDVIKCEIETTGL